MSTTQSKAWGEKVSLVKNDSFQYGNGTPF